MNDAQPLLGLDCDFDVSPFAPMLASAGIGFVGQYLRTWLTKDSVARLHDHGIKVMFYWETTATAALQGGGKGAADGGAALRKLTSLGAPSETAVYMAVDADVMASQMWAIEDYFYAADGQLWGHYRIGGYADGTAISALRQHGLPLCVLAGAMGWSGSQAFAHTGNPNVVQGPTLTGGGSWPHAGLLPNIAPIVWPRFEGALASYDPLIALTPDFGAW